MISDFVCEKELIQKINLGDENAFEYVFHLYYDRLCRFSAGYVGSIDQARDVVQEVFIVIWENRHALSIETSLKTYLFQAVKNRSINAIIKNKRIRTLKDKIEFQSHTKSDSMSAGEEDPEETSDPGLEKIWMHVYQLPEKRKAVFTLHRKHGLSYKEISVVMGITRKTVENQMGKALKYLRSVLSKDQFV